MEQHAATVAAQVATAEPTPTIDEIVASYVEDQEKQRADRVNVFTECIRDGQVVVTSEEQASEIARLMNRADHELEDAQAIAAAIIRKAQARVDSLEFLFKLPLEIWTSAKLAGKKTRSLILEGGKLSLRKVPASVKTVDPVQLLGWAQIDLPAAVEMVPRIKLETVKAWEEQSGKAAPGREATPEHDSFKVGIPK